MRSVQYLFIAAVILASCGGDKKGTPAEQLVQLKKERAALDAKIAKLESQVVDTNKKPTPVSVATLQPTAFSAYIEVQSQITGDQNIYALPQAPGTVTAIHVKPGDRVSKGQLLATLDASSIEQQIKAQDAQLQLAKSLYEKQQKLWAENIGTEVQLIQAKANYEAMQKQREATVAQRNMYRIVAPISGVVDQVDARIGQQSGMSGGIRIVNNSVLKAEASLGENYLGKVKTGDPVTLVFEDINDSLSTRLSYVAQAVDPVSRAFTVQVRLSPDKKLHPNMSCKMKIANYRNSDALVVPVHVIQNTSEGEMLYLAEGNKAKSVIVRTGRNSNGMVEILSGLKAGDRVIVAGYEEVDNGEAIQVK